MLTCVNRREYLVNEIVIPLVTLSPEFGVGTRCIVISRANGTLLAVRLPDGQIYRWLTVFDLESTDPNIRRILEGKDAYVTTNRLSPLINEGNIVYVVKRVEQTDYYEITPDAGVHRFILPGINLTNKV